VQTPRPALPVIAVLGNSLSAGFGFDWRQGWVERLQERLAQRGFGYQVVNASISGDTTRSGAVRLPRLLAEQRPAILIVELGGNDGLRGISLEETRKQLTSIVRMGKDGGAKVLLVGMHLPPNYGPLYTQGFHALYKELAEQFQVPLVPFLLEGIAGDPALMQTDGIHPKPQAQERILENVWPYLEPFLNHPP
jgi:acyl-CoA thioesterase-1